MSIARRIANYIELRRSGTVPMLARFVFKYPAATELLVGSVVMSINIALLRSQVDLHSL